MPDDPTFPTSLRGYTRELVDAYVARTAGELADSEHRRTAAERALAAHRDGAEPALALAVSRAGELEQELAAARSQVEQEVAYRAQVEQELAAARSQGEQEAAYRAQVEQELAVARLQVEQELAYRAQVELELAATRSQVEQEAAYRAQVEQELAAARSRAAEPASPRPDDGAEVAQVAVEKVRGTGSARLMDVDTDRFVRATPAMVAASVGTASVATTAVATTAVATTSVGTASVGTATPGEAALDGSTPGAPVHESTGDGLPSDDGPVVDPAAGQPSHAGRVPAEHGLPVTQIQAVHAVPATAVQPEHAAPVTEVQAVPSGRVEPVRPEEIRPLPHPRPPGPRRRRSSAPWWTLAGLAAVAAVVLTAALRDEDPTRPAAASVTQPPVAGTQAPTPSAEPSAAATAATVAASAAPTTATRPTVLPAGAVPRGWRRFQAPGAPWSIALPPNWRSVGRGDDLRFVSGSGLSQMYVRTVPAAAVPDQAALQRRERAFAATHPGYRRIRVEVLPYKGLPAGFWDYTYGSGRQTRRASDMALVLNDRGYQLHVESRASSWRFAAPLVQGFRSSFAPT